jgi:hypothetical protein
MAKGFNKFSKNRDFRMIELENRERDFPRKGFTSNFYIPLPKSLSLSETKRQILLKLNILMDFGVMPRKSMPRVVIPSTSRESDEHRGKAFVTFSRDTPLDTVVTVRTLLHCTKFYLNDEDSVLMECYWAKENKNPKRDVNKSPNKSPGKTGKTGKVEKPEKTPVKTTATKTVPPKFKALPSGTSQWSKPLNVTSATPVQGGTTEAGTVSSHEVNDVTDTTPKTIEETYTSPAMNGNSFPTLSK